MLAGINLHLNGDLLGWAITVAITVMIVGSVVALFVTSGAWLNPRITKMSKGLKTVSGPLPCCPPGLGCNDPSLKHSDRRCTRLQALKVAKVEEILALNEAWAKTSGAPKSRELRARYEGVRDSIIARAFRDAAEDIDAARENKLPQLGGGGNGKSTKESAQGEVMY